MKNEKISSIFSQAIINFAAIITKKGLKL